MRCRGDRNRERDSSRAYARDPVARALAAICCRRGVSYSAWIRARNSVLRWYADLEYIPTV